MSISYVFNPFTGNFDAINSGGVTVYPGAGIAVSTGSAWATSITGTSSQFVKADGSLDSSTYLTASTLSIVSDSPLSGAGTSASHLVIAQANTTTAGYLSSTDWNTFNNKQPAGSYLTSVTADSPLSGSGTSGSHLVIATANTSTTGALTSTDWNTFNGKQAAGNYITALTSDVTASGPGSVAATIAANAVTYAKFQQVAASSLVGNATGSLANATGITLVSPLVFSGSTLGTINSSLNKASVRVTSSTALTVTYSNGSSGVGATLTNAGTQSALVIDGVTLSVNDRVVVTAQASTLQNGVYSVTNVGSGSTNWVMTRTADFDGSVLGGINYGATLTSVAGTVNAGIIWIYNGISAPTVGSTAITFVGNSASSGGGGVTLTSPGATLTIGGTSTNPTADIALTHANTWTGVQTLKGTILTAGTATAGTAPLYFNSGTNLTVAVAGATEFTTDDLRFTITTGTARKTVALTDSATALTSGQMLFTTTNGRLTTSANATYTATTGLQIIAGATTAVPVIAKGAASQTADLSQCQDSSANVLSKVDVNGSGFFSGTGQSIIQTGIVINQSLDATSASPFVVNGSTGAVIATNPATGQALGLFGATPILQPTTAYAAATLVGGGGTNITDTDTFDGYTLKQIVKALRGLGLLA